MVSEEKKSYVALSALQPGMRDEIIDIPISASASLQCRFIPFGFLINSFIERKTLFLVSERRKKILAEYESGERENEMANSIAITYEMLKDSLSDEELRQMCSNSDRLRLDEVKGEEGNITFALRSPGDYSSIEHEELLARLEKELLAETLLALEIPIWSNYLPEWYGLTEEELKKLTADERQVRRRQLIDVEQSRRRDQMIGLKRESLLKRLAGASAQLVAQDDAGRYINAIKLWSITRTVEDREEKYFTVTDVNNLQEAMDRPKHVYSEIMRLLQDDENLLGGFIQAYTRYSAKLEIPSGELDEVAQQPFRSELPAPSKQDEPAALQPADL